MAVTNRQLLTRGDRTYAKKKAAARVESVSFDPEAREQYLTGFHKRKLARQAESKKRAEERARQDKIEERKKLRAERYKSIETELSKLKEAEKLIGQGMSDDEDGEDADDQDEENADEIDEEFKGFENDSGILKKISTIYKDEDGANETQVTVEEIQLDPFVDLSRAQEVLESSTQRANDYAKYVESLSNPQPAKPKKKKFRYLGKTQRKVIAKKQKQR